MSPGPSSSEIASAVSAPRIARSVMYVSTLNPEMTRVRYSAARYSIGDPTACMPAVGGQRLHHALHAHGARAFHEHRHAGRSAGRISERRQLRDDRASRALTPNASAAARLCVPNQYNRAMPDSARPSSPDFAVHRGLSGPSSAMSPSTSQRSPGRLSRNAIAARDRAGVGVVGVVVERDAPAARRRGAVGPATLRTAARPARPHRGRRPRRRTPRPRRARSRRCGCRPLASVACALPGRRVHP